MTEIEDNRFKALAHPLRRVLLSELKDAPKPLIHLVWRTGASPSRISNHLKLMEEAHLVVARKQGRRRVYALNRKGLLDPLAYLKSLTE